METVRRIDDLGRIVVPAEIRNQLGIKAGAECRVSLDGESIRIEPCENVCIICGKKATIDVIPGKYICKACAAEIKNKV